MREPLQRSGVIVDTTSWSEAKGLSCTEQGDDAHCYHPEVVEQDEICLDMTIYSLKVAFAHGKRFLRFTDQWPNRGLMLAHANEGKVQ